MKKKSRALAPPRQDDLARQPAQLELFRMITGPEQTNAFDFYESIPRFYTGRGHARAAKHNADGTTPPIERTYTYAGKRYWLTIEPGFVRQKDGSLAAQFPGVREDIVEFVLFKLAVEQGYFYSPDGNNAETDNFVLITSLYAIHEQLKRRWERRDKTKSYSYAQIREALLVLSKTKLHLKSDAHDEDDIVVSPISDFGFYGKGRAGTGSSNATLYIRFNSLISKSVLAREWRQINYQRVMASDSYLVRWLRKMLSLRFVQAAPNKPFNIKLTTIIENSGITRYDRMSDNLKYVCTALDAMPDVIDRRVVDKRFGPHPKTGKGRVLLDAIILLWPTQRFSTEQIQTNIHIGALSEAQNVPDYLGLDDVPDASQDAFQAEQAAKMERLRRLIFAPPDWDDPKC